MWRRNLHYGLSGGGGNVYIMRVIVMGMLYEMMVEVGRD